jgi:predicted nucleotidyltransferase
MSSLASLLGQVAALLGGVRQPWALVGGLAVSVRTEPRFTRDVDLAVAVADDPAAEALLHTLQKAGYRAQATVEQEKTRRLATVRLMPAGEHPQGLMLDLLFASSGIEPEICAAAETIAVFPGVDVQVARLHHLMALKTLARDDQSRPQDAADLRGLILAAAPADLEAACEAARLIERRGFNRERDLIGALRTAWREWRA